MGSVFKRLFSGQGAPHVPTLVYTTPALTSTVLREIQVTNPGFVGVSSVPLGRITGLSQGASGAIYYMCAGAIFKLAPTGLISLIAGQPGLYGSNVLTGRAAQFGSSTGNLCTSCIVDSTETYLYVLDATNNRVVRVTIATGVLTAMVTGLTMTNTTNGTWVMQQMSLSPDGTKLLIPHWTTGNGTLRQINTASPFTGADVAGFSIASGTGISMQGVAHNADGTKAYVSYQATNSSNPVGRIAEVTLATGASISYQTNSSTSNTDYADGPNLVSSTFWATMLQFVPVVAQSGGVFIYGSQWNRAVVRLLNPISSSYHYITTVVGKQNWGSMAPGESALITGYPGTARVPSLEVSLAPSYDGNNLLIGADGAILVHSLQTGYTTVLAGSTIKLGVNPVEGEAPYLTDAAFNLYIVPNGDTLDIGLHRRFSNETVSLSSTWFGEVRKNLNAGDKIYFEPLGFNLTVELSGLEVS